VASEPGEKRVTIVDEELLDSLQSSQYMCSSSAQTRPYTLQTAILQYLEKENNTSSGEEMPYEEIIKRLQKVEVLSIRLISFLEVQRHNISLMSKASMD